ncbi:sugar isomerase domain-containing protein [Phytoactinopolyspora limicola]|uniref:sugar isomerase domain-containing protein n=1 Tax=Phytoactinopolyspora limicola TaxID=2715536 RepID=UPI00140E38DD|nr:sugar isomerase domain-containing protein [Phytoactinopolyspora limicola]
MSAAARTRAPSRPETILNDYLGTITSMLESIRDEEAENLQRAAHLLAGHIKADRLVHVYGPGGHSNLAAQEIFFRAGGLAHVSAILDEGTLLSSGALRSMAMERTPGYGALVLRDNQLGPGDLLVLVNAYGINAAVIDAAEYARAHDITVVGISSTVHAESTPPDHPARHPSGANLHDLVDVHIDTKVPVGDAVLWIDGIDEPIAAVSTFVNAYALNCLGALTTAVLVDSGVTPPIWRSGNAPGGDEQHATFLDQIRTRVRWL